MKFKKRVVIERKFPLRRGARCEIEMPEGAEILKIALQGTVPTIWALVDPLAKRVERCFAVVMTGESAALERRKYIETIFIDPYVFHIFDLGEV